MKSLKWFIINSLLSNKERGLIKTSIRDNAYRQYKTMSDTSKEDSDELFKLNSNIKFKNHNQFFPA